MNLSSLKYIILDFDGVIIDSEIAQFQAVQNILAREGIELTEEEHRERYFGWNDWACLEDMLRRHRAEVSAAQLQKMVAEKGELYFEGLKREKKIFPGALELIQHLRRRYALAICSGSPRREIEWVLSDLGVVSHFATIVGADDVGAISKPDPRVYRHLLTELEKGGDTPVEPSQCLAIEDAAPGLESARRNGLYTIGYTSTYDRKLLEPWADLIVDDLREIIELIPPRP